MEDQLDLFGERLELRQPPSTRYQGSKQKLLPWIWTHLSGLAFDTVLDAFGGTGCVSYMLKDRGKDVTYNDYLRFNHRIGIALIENTGVRLSADDVAFLLRYDPRFEYSDFVQRTFSGIYFTDSENEWIDVVCQNIPRIGDRFKQAIAYCALFQACIIKRPYNLFHRKNLYMRTADVTRGFGNKATWDTPFEVHFRKFVSEINESVFDSGVPCRALCHDASDISGRYDLVYIDTPYISGKGVGVDYFDFYHFLEGIVGYETWPKRIDSGRKHRPLKGTPCRWSDPKLVHAAFRDLFECYSDATLVVSYRSDGIPSEDELGELLSSVKKTVRCEHFGAYKYVLSKNNSSREILFIAE